jgi:hypothetical protein
MQYKGINYDTGMRTTTGGITRQDFDPDTIAKEISIIKNELHCNAIRISGLHLERLAKASEIALKMGLTVWFSPSAQYESQENTFNYLTEGAVIAEKLRAEFENVVFVTGCELSLFTMGFVKGQTGAERINNLFSPISLLKNGLGIKRTYNKNLNNFLTRLMKNIRNEFYGQVTYASGTWENVDWNLFDMIGIDHYRSAFNKSTYLKELKKYQAMGKAVCIMEFGCCTYKGAEDRGVIGWNIVDWKKNIPELKGNYIRDEEVQARYLLELLKIFEDEKVFAAFAFTFVFYNYAYHKEPKFDLDMASYGIVKALPNSEHGTYQGLPWMPKRAFFELGRYYANHPNSI